jgi:hypothetical protein
MSANDGALALELLNGLLDQWSAESLAIYESTRTVKAFTPSDGTYTVGTGGDVNIVRPVFIDAINLVNANTSPSIETPLNWLTDPMYQAIPQKDLTNTYPQSWWYDPTFSNARGTLQFWPIPTGSNLSFALYSPTAVARFAALTTAFSLPPGYERMLRTNLALELAAPFEKEPSDWLIEAARESKATVKRANIRPVELRIDAGALIGYSGHYDVYSDSNR